MRPYRCTFAAKAVLTQPPEQIVAWAMTQWVAVMRNPHKVGLKDPHDGDALSTALEAMLIKLDVYSWQVDGALERRLNTALCCLFHVTFSWCIP